MNYNTIGYSIFLAVIFFITFHVGWKFYKNGEVYLHMLIPQDSHLVSSINKLLLVGYYLLNLGYAAVSIAYWPTIESIDELCRCLSNYTGILIIGLALMHYFNMTWLLIYSRYMERKLKQADGTG